MKKLLILALFISIVPVRAQNDFPLTPDSKVQEGVPKGEVLKFTFDKSTIFPGTSREYWLYVPRQYDPAKPACVYVNQDGIQWNAPVVFDNLIHKGEMPITIGVFVRPGVVPAANENALPRFNRSFEYDGLGNNYARFLLEELLPEVEKQKTTDGRAIVLSKNGNDRAIGGSSSGAIAAFTAAWERPDAFSRVFSAIGTYVGLRGGNEYPTLIRKMEPKPLRIFLQGGSNDNNIYGGDWWMANQEMQRALAFAGYEVNHVWGTGGHSGAHGTQLFPDAMRYLWKDWPQPLKAGLGSPQLKEILIPGEDWQISDQPYGQGKLFVDAQGKVTTDTKAAVGPLWATNILPPMSLFTEIVPRSDGSLYLLDLGNYSSLPNADTTPVPCIWHIAPGGARKIVAQNVPFGALTMSPDQSLLYGSDGRKWIWSYQIQPDGSLTHKQKYYHLHTFDTFDSAGAFGMCVDRDGRLYVATTMGIQVCDQAGRVNCIIPFPGGAAGRVVLGGPEFDTLFAASGGKIYKRKVKTKGAPSFLPPIKPAPPRL